MHSEPVSVVTTSGCHHVRAIRPVAPGEIVLHLYGQPVARPDRYTLQLGETLHMDAADIANPGHFHPWRYLNHACEPNTAIRGRDVVAIRPIQPGDEVTFHYNTTEYDMASPFTCHCGSPICAGEIRGFRHLSAAEKQRLAPLLAPHLHRLSEAA